MSGTRPSALRRLDSHNASPREEDSGNSRRESRGSERPRGERSEERRRSKSRSSRREHRSRSDEEDETIPRWAQQILDGQSESDNRLKTLEKRVKETNAKQPSARKREHSPAPEFKFRRNKVQYELNKNVLRDPLSPLTTPRAQQITSKDCVDPSPSVKGRLKEHVRFWELIGASCWVLKVIRDGYALPFVDLPQKRMSGNHKSATRSAKFVISEIEKLLGSGCVKEVSSDQVHVFSPLSVASNHGKNRLILDLRYINSCLRVLKFKYEDLRTFKDIFRQGDWIFKFDYKSGYHHIDILPEHWQYLGFSWGEGDSKRFFVFTVLPFGLATAPYVFTKVQKALLKSWRLQGIRIFTYLDDGIGGHSSAQQATTVSNKVKNDVEQSGFLWHPDKSVWEPTQCTEVLGFIVNLVDGCFRVPERRITKLNNQLHNIQSNNYQTTAYNIAKLTGTIISMGLALGPMARLWTRGLYRNLAYVIPWGETVHLDKDAIREIKFWVDSFAECHGQKIWLSDPIPEVLTYSDASNTGWGGYCVQISDLGGHSLP